MSFFNWAKNFGGFAPGTNLVTVPTVFGNITANAEAAPHFQNFLSDFASGRLQLYSYSPRDMPEPERCLETQST